MPSWLEIQQRGIARLRDPATGAVCGTAFLIGPRHVMTCAHVVSQAMGPDGAEQTGRPQTAVQIDFPFVKPLVTARATVVEWRPPAEAEAADIAVLELDQEVALEREVAPVVLRTTTLQPRPGLDFWSKGFPGHLDVGMEAAGVLGTSVEHGRVLVQGEGQEGFFITGGFSGAPILDRKTGSVLGMAVEEVTGEGLRLAFIIPVDQIEQAWPPMARPYKGLGSFDEADARFFHGRERYVQRLEAKLERYSLVAVLGRSGWGKSSLVRAGLIPRLRNKQEWRIVTFRPGSPAPNPLRNLALALLDELKGAPARDNTPERLAAAQALGDQLYRDPQEIVAQLKAVGGASDRAQGLPVLLVVDQFEELFTSVPEAANVGPEAGLRARFVQCLRAAVGGPPDRPNCRCVITLRDDYLGRVLEIDGFADALADADVKLGPMEAKELRNAIEQPARSLGVAFEGDFAAELADALLEWPDGLPLLEFMLAELWANQRDRTLHPPRLDDGEAGPGRRAAVSAFIAAALTRHADATLDRLPRSFSKAMVRKVFLDLVWVADGERDRGGNSRRVRQRHEFSDTEWTLIETLASQDQQARLVTIGAAETGGGATVEIVHDALIRNWKTLGDWLREQRLFRLWLQKMEETASEWRLDTDFPLLQGKRLTEAHRWRGAYPDESASVADYVDRSILSYIESVRFSLETRIKRLKQEMNSLKNRTFWLIVGGLGIIAAAAIGAALDFTNVLETGIFVFDKKICDCRWMFALKEWRDRPAQTSLTLDLGLGVVICIGGLVPLYFAISPSRRAARRLAVDALQQQVNELADQLAGLSVGSGSAPPPLSRETRSAPLLSAPPSSVPARNSG